MADKQANVVLNFKMTGQVEYAKTVRDINAIMNAAASEYKTHIAAMGKDAEVTQKLAAEKKKLEIQLEAAQERTKMLRNEYEALAKDTNTSAGQLANKYKQLQNSERAEIALANALERVNDELSDQAEEARRNQEALGKLESEAEALESQTEKLNAEFELQQAQLGENASESEKLKTKIEHLEKAHDLAGEKVKNYEEQLELAKKQYGENSTEAQKYETKLLEAKTAEQQLANEIEKTNKKLEQQKDELKKTGDQLKKAGEKMKDIGKDMSMKVTAPIVGLGTVATKSAIDFESAFAGVRKTVDTTEEKFEELEQGIRDMSKELPTSASEIAGVAEAAGQLGIETDNILDFTKTVIDLGEATNLTLDDAATEFARFANIVGMSQSDFSKLGSTVVSLGNNFATTEAEIVAMGMRLAAQGKQVGMSEAQIMALAATMSSLGIEAEAGGTAMTTVLKKIDKAVGEGGKSLEGFAEAAGVSSKEFKTAWESDPITALDMFINGLSKSGEAGENLSTILADLSIKGIRESDTILRMAGASDLLSEAVNNSTQAWKENTALSNEAAQRYETTASQLQMFKNQITDLAIDIGNILIPMLLSLLDAVRPWVDKFKEMDESMQKTIVVIAGIVAAIPPLLMIFGSMASGLGSIIGLVSKVATFFGGWAKIAATLKAGLAALSGPIGWIILAIGALIAIGIALYKNWDTIKEKAIELKNVVVEKFNEIKDKIVEFFKVTIPEAFNNFVQFLAEFPTKVMEFLNKLFTEDIPYIIGYGIGWMITHISEGIEKTIDFFRKLPERKREFLLKAVKNIAIWAVEIKNKGIEAGREFLNNIINFFKQLPERAGMFLLNTIARMIKFRNDMNQKAMETGKKVFNSIVDGIKQLPGRLKSMGSDIIRGLVNGIKNSISNVVGIAKDIASNFTRGFKNAMGIKSPSRVMMAIAKNIIEGLGIGIEKMTDYAVNKTKVVAKGISNAMKNEIKLPNLQVGPVVGQPNLTSGSSGFRGTTTEYNYQTLDMNGLFNGAVFNVRDDQDIPRLAKELNDYIRMGARGKGVIIL